jgi:serine/threonine protein kinase
MRDGRVKILVFGLAKRPEQIEAAHTIVETTPGAIGGTAAYMSPEQARGQAVDFRSDRA